MADAETTEDAWRAYMLTAVMKPPAPGVRRLLGDTTCASSHCDREGLWPFLLMADQRETIDPELPEGPDESTEVVRWYCEMHRHQWEVIPNV